MRVLVAEDDPILNGQIKSALLEDGHAIDVVDDGVEAYFMGSSEPYDVIILDIGMPKRDGISVLKQLRKDNVETPVLILTARDGWSESVDGLDAGADDYMSKPFYMPELSARIRALIRYQGL